MSQHQQTGVSNHFPSPRERRRIIERRNALSYALYRNLALRETDPAGAGARTQALIREYGLSEVKRMMDRIGRHVQA